MMAVSIPSAKRHFISNLMLEMTNFWVLLLNGVGTSPDPSNVYIANP